MAESNQAGIPICDIHSPDAASELLRACCDYGFIYVKHEALGLTPADVEEMFEIVQSKAFFAADPQVKAEASINSAKSGKNHGWLSMHTETLDPAKQKVAQSHPSENSLLLMNKQERAFNVGEYIDGRPQQYLPSPLQPYQAAIGSFQDKCHALCNQILTLLAQALKVSAASGGDQWFSSRHDQSKGPSGTVLRLLYYPELPGDMHCDKGEDIRAGAHSDYGSLTLLFRLPGQPGLEVRTPAGQWAEVPVDPDPYSSSDALPILVNIGDLLSFWTHGLLKSTVHRVVFPSGRGKARPQERYSIAYFCHPEDSAQLVEIPSEVVSAHASAKSASQGHGSATMTAADHLNSRLAATYGIPSKA